MEVVPTTSAVSDSIDDVKRPIQYFNDQFDNNMKKNIVE